MAAVQASVAARAAAEGAVIPPDLVKLTAVLVEYAVKDLGNRNGGSPRMPGLTQLRSILNSAGASASGTPSASLGPQAQARSITLSEAAAVMGISERWVRHLAAADRIRARKEGRDWRIDWDSARDYRPGGGTT